MKRALPIFLLVSLLLVSCESVGSNKPAPAPSMPITFTYRRGVNDYMTATIPVPQPAPAASSTSSLSSTVSSVISAVESVVTKFLP